MKKKKALITGINGQDGSYLAKFLIDKGYKVYGTCRRSTSEKFTRLKQLDVFDKIDEILEDAIKIRLRRRTHLHQQTSALKRKS